MSVNKFDKPTKLVDRENFPSATQVLITRLILLEPGTIQSHPEMGVGIVSRYRFTDADDLTRLEQDIADQVSKYLPELHDVDVDIQNFETTIRITLSSNGLVYTASVDKSTHTLSQL